MKKIIALLLSACMLTVSATVFAQDADLTKPITRGETAVLLNASEAVYSGTEPVFTDVKKGDSDFSAIGWAKKNGIINGMGDGTFMPNAEITREQLAVILFNYANFKGIDTTQGGMGVRELADYESVSAWALSSVAWSMYSGIMSMDEKNNYGPKDTVTQSQFEEIMNKLSKVDKADKK